MTAPPVPSRWTFFWLAQWAGLAVACIYFSQPLLHALGAEFTVPDDRMGLVSTVTQAGYGLGIFLLVPLGDFLPTRRLVRTKLALLAAATLGCSLSPGFGALLLTSFLVGVFATTAQDLVPLAADIAPDERRGQYVGLVMTGLMLGILLSRTVSGIVGDSLGWRRVFQLGAAAIAVSFVASWFAFPAVPPKPPQGHLATAYTSMVTLLRRHARLRLAVVRHGLLGMAFSAFWTNLSFFLSDPPFGWDASRIGLMGLAGAGGALATTFMGRLTDVRGPRFGIRIATVVTFASFLAMAVWQRSAATIVVATIAFDFGIQSSLVSHQSIIYGLDPAARGRINGIFVTALFVFFAIGSAVSAQIWGRAGWTGLMAFCCASALGAFALTFVRPADPSGTADARRTSIRTEAHT
jgi:predicted MFS family arabinose efflux permease